MRERVEEALSALQQAMRNELEGIALYEEAIERTEDSLGKKMFRSLAKDEEDHLRILQVEYGSLMGTGEWLDLEAIKGKEPDPSLHLFPEESKKMLQEGTSDLEALELAMEFERRGYLLYEKAAAQSASPTAQTIYRFLVQEESRHFALLQNAHDYLANKGFWYFDDVEKPFFEG